MLRRPFRRAGFRPGAPGMHKQTAGPAPATERVKRRHMFWSHALRITLGLHQPQTPVQIPLAVGAAIALPGDALSILA